MAERGLLPKPDVAIFADTGTEPPNVYAWLETLKSLLSYEVLTVDAGNLAETSTRVRISKKTGNAYLSHNVPSYAKNFDLTKGLNRRQCTDKHKIRPLLKAINKLRKRGPAEVWIGISTDEASRMKDSKVKGITHKWPLIDMNLSRIDCLSWMKDQGFPVPPRSACVFCPFHSDSEWVRLKTEDKPSFEAAVAYEKSLQKAASLIPRITSTPFLHRSLMPLDQVDFSANKESKQLNLFNNECEGMCGL